MSCIYHIKKYLLTVVYLSGLYLMSQQINTVVPTINSSMQVSKTGSLTYHVPIEIPKGVHNFQPNLALVYDSNNGEGVAGLGWNIFGLSAITRGGKIEKIDGVTEGMQYDDQDPYYLDGNRMLKQPNGTYVLENFSHTFIKKENNEYIVQYPDGRIATYHSWVRGQYSLKSLEDALDNRIEYYYNEKENTLYLDRIVYGKDKEFVIEFVQTTRHHPVKIWRKSRDLVNDKVIKEINIKAQGLLYRKYVLHYELTSKGSERLQRITIENGQGEALKPLDFTYNEKVPSFQFERQNIINAGLPDGTEKIGASVTGDFYGNGKITSIYALKKEGTLYDLWSSKYGKLDNKLTSSISEDTQLFAGKVFVGSNKLPQNDLLIVVNVERHYWHPTFRSPAQNYNPYLTIDFIDLKNKTRKEYTTPVFNEEDIDEGYLRCIFRDFTGDGSIDLMFFLDNSNITSNIRTSNIRQYQHIPSTRDKTPRYRKSNYTRQYRYRPSTRDKTPRYRSSNYIRQYKPRYRNLTSKEEYRTSRRYNTGKAYLIDFTKVSSSEGTDNKVTMTSLLDDTPIPLKLNKDSLDQLYPIEFDGDGIPEILWVATQNNTFGVLKYDGKAKKLRVALKNHQSLRYFSDKTPLILGDYNGDGLTDFMTPHAVYDIEKEGTERIFRRIKDEKHIWEKHMNMGGKFISESYDFTDQKLSYCTPSQRNVIKKSSWFAKFWSGKGDKYRYTEYATCSVIPMDFDYDGRTDLISIQKFGKVKYDEELKNSEITNSDISITQTTRVYEDPDFQEDCYDEAERCPPSHLVYHITGPDKFNQIQFIQNTYRNTDKILDFIDAQGIFKTQKTFKIHNDKISPISFIVTSQDHPTFNGARNQLMIHDPLSEKDYQFSISSDHFLESKIQKVDNHSGLIQAIEYQPLDNQPNNPAYAAYDKPGQAASNKLEQYQGDLYAALGKRFYLHQRLPGQYVVSHINTSFDNHTLTKRYRYINAIQDLEGKGFLGFMTTMVSDNYESIRNNRGQYEPKDYKKPILWTINRYDPSYDHQLIETTYGGVNERQDQRSLLTRSIIEYKKITSQTHALLKPNQTYYKKTREENRDYKKNIHITKTYHYDESNLLLRSVMTDYNSEGTSESHFSYAAPWTNGAHRFYGKISEETQTTKAYGDTFSTRNEIDYQDNGLVKQKKKYGNHTDAVTTAYTYDKHGNTLTQAITAEGETLTTAYTYDDTQRFVVSTTSPEGLTAKTEVDIYGNPLKTTSPLGLETHYTYDGWNNLIKTADYLGNETRHERHPTREGGYFVTEVREGFPKAMTYYDKLNRAVRTKTQGLHGKWSVVDTRYDVYGKVIRQSEPYFEGAADKKWNRTVYDVFDRPIQKISYTGKIVNLCYSGRTATVDDGYEETAETIDAMGNIITHRDKGGEINYRYYANGTLKQADYDGAVIKVEQDGWGNKTRLEDPSAGVYEYTYDDWGRKLTEKTPKGLTRYGYDRFGKLLYEIQEGDHTQLSSQYIYDLDNHLLQKIIGNNGTDTFEYETFYDEYYRITGKKETHPAFTYETHTTFDRYGRSDRSRSKVEVTNTHHPIENEQQNRYDSQGILYALADLKTGQTIWERKEENAQGQPLDTKLGNGFDLINEYKNDLPVHIEQYHAQNGQVAVSISYDFDVKKGVLNRRYNKIFEQTESFTFDDLKRLTEEHHNGKRAKQYAYDPRGRITYNTDLGQYEYPPDTYHLNKIRFNAQGEEAKAQRGFPTITYNAYKKPVEINLPQKDRISYEYNLMRGRAAAYYGSEAPDKYARPLRKYYSADHALEITYDTRTQIIKVAQYLDGDPYDASYVKISQFENREFKQTNAYYLHRDYLGSILAISDHQGKLVEQRRFDAWGNLADYTAFCEGLTRDHPLLDRGYTGHEHLWSVGLIQMNARLYDPLLRRFLSPDNFVPDPYHTQHYNRYGYVLNNPLLYTDPSGNFPFLIVAQLLFKSVVNLSHGVPFWYGWGRTAAMAVVSHGIGNVVSSGGALADASSTVKALFQAGAHGLSGGIFNAIDGDSFGIGFLSSAAASAVGSGVDHLGINSVALYTAAEIASGGLSGGLGSVIAGGDFWRGAEQGVIATAYNHAVHGLYNKITLDGGPGDGKGKKKKYSNWISIRRYIKSLKKRILSFSHNLEETGSMFSDWLLGEGEENRIIEGNAFADAFRDAYQVKNARRYWYKKALSTNNYKVSVTNYGASFGIQGLFRAGLDPAEQYVGSYRIDINSNGKNLKFILTNTTSFTSFFYGIAPSWSRESMPYMGNMTQKIIFTEPIKK